MGGTERHLVARAHPQELLVERCDDGTGTQQVAVSLGLEPIEHLSVARALQIDGDVVALGCLAFHVGELAVLRTEPVHLLLDLVLGDLGAGNLDSECLIALDGHHRAHLDGGLEGDVARFLTLGDVDVGRGHHVHVVFYDRLGVLLGQFVAKGLAACVPGFDLALQELAGSLAGTETGEIHLFGDLLPCEIQRWIQFLLVQIDHELHLVALEGLDFAVHKRERLEGAHSPATAAPAEHSPIGPPDRSDWP